MRRERSPDDDHDARAPNRDGNLRPKDRGATNDVRDSSHHWQVFGGVSAIGTCFARPKHWCPRQASGHADQSPWHLRAWPAVQLNSVSM